MSRIDDLIARLCPDGVERRALGDVGTFVRGNGLQKKDLTDTGVPAIHYGQIFTHYGIQATSTKSFVHPEAVVRLRRANPGDLVIATTSENDEDVGKAVAWLGDSEAVVSGDAYIYRHSLDPAYAAYFFQSGDFSSQKTRHITGTKVRRLSGASLAGIRVPVPPLEVQREIVRVLDTFSQLEAELEAELETRRRQYEHYRDALLTFGGPPVPWSDLGSVSRRVTSGGTPLVTKSEYYDGDIPWLRTNEVSYADIHSTEKYITELGLRSSSAKWVAADSVIIALSGAGVTRGRAAMTKIPLTTNQHCCALELDATVARPRFVFHWLVKSYDDLRSRGQGNRSDLNIGIVKRYPLPLPRLTEQDRIVATLDSFDALVNDLSSGLPAELAARRKQYEHYRDRLLTFKEKAA